MPGLHGNIKLNALCWCTGKHVMRSMSAFFWSVLTITLLLSACGVSHLPGDAASTKASGQSDQKASQPNIVLILADDQGWRDVGFNTDHGEQGERFYETPAIDRLAAGGMVFSQAYSSGPNCAPTRASLISGMYPPRHLIYQPNGAAKGDPRLMKLNVPLMDERLKKYGLKKSGPSFDIRTELEPSVTSIAEVLNSAGYTTARFGKWHLGPDNQGFDISSSDGSAAGSKLHHKKENKFYGDANVVQRLTNAATGFIRDNRDKPFFLFVSHFDVHKPLVADEQVVARYRKKLNSWQGEKRDYNPIYGAMNEAVDNSVEQIIATLEALKLSENTLVIYTSDNGPVASVSSAAPLRAGKGSLYEGGVRVPFAAYWPGTIKASSLSQQPITSVDLLPTFAEFAGAPLPDSQVVDGVSLAALLVGDDAIPERPIFWHYPLYLEGQGAENFIPLTDGSAGAGLGWRAKPASAIRWGDWKLIEYFEKPHSELYNIVDDPGESTELSAVHPEVKNRLLNRLKLWQKNTSAVIPEKGIGYVQIH